MMRILSVFLCVTISFTTGTSVELNNSPGKVVFWTPTTSDSNTVRLPEYRTQSVGKNDVNNIFEENLKNKEIVVLIKSIDNIPLSHSSIKRSIHDSTKATIVPNIYHTENSDKKVLSMFSGLELVKNAKKIDLLSFIEILESHDKLFGAKVGPLNNGKLDAYEIILNGNEIEKDQMKTISNYATKNEKNEIIFVTYQEPGINAHMNLLKASQYDRILTASSSNLKGIYYKPEGAEYSIYYADTFLYITPDIFTGLMTGIFCFFVLLTGYSCLGAIQGNSVYPSKMPVLGREA